MSTFHEGIRNVLTEVDKFIESLKNEKLSKKVQTGRDKVVEAIKKLRKDFPALESQSELTVPDNDADHVSNESIKTKGSHGSGNAEEEDVVYSENVAEKSVKDLTDPTKAGFLDKRRKKPTLLQSAYQKRYCIVKDRFFYYFEKTTDKKQAGAFSLEGYEFKEAPQYVQGKDVNKKVCFELTSPGKRSFQGRATEEVNDLVFLVDSKEEFQAWQEAITGSSSVYENYEDLNKQHEGVEHKYMRHSMDYSADGYLRPVQSPSQSKSEPQYQNDAPSYQNEAPHYQNEAPKTRNSIQVKDEKPSLPQGPPPSQKRNSVQIIEKPSLPQGIPPSQKPKSVQIIEKPSLPQGPPPSQKRNNVQVIEKPSLPQGPPPSKKQETPPKLPPPRREPIRLSWHPEVDYENMYYGKWDHNAEAATEQLAFKYGDIIHIINRDLDNSGWWIGRKGDNYGLVAKLFLAPAYTPFKGK